jgi:poly-gamma-glutamate synthesis protein (capsule biosynthesis protein)
MLACGPEASSEARPEANVEVTNTGASAPSAGTVKPVGTRQDDAERRPAATLVPSNGEDPPTAATSLQMALVGDVIFGRYREDGFDPIVPDGVDPFEKIRPALADALVLGNLETPVVEVLPERSPSHSEHRFGADRRHVRGLAAAGFDVVSLANNHLYDLRLPGLRESAAILAAEGVMGIGGSTESDAAVRVQTLQRDGWSIAFVAVTSRLNMNLPEGPPYIPFVRASDLEERVGPLVEGAAAEHDVVVVSVHWGDEYRDDAAYGQRTAARALVRRGATLVHGHHPHVLQGIESYEGGVIAYSMGNFLFSNASKIPRQTGVLRVGLTRHGPRSPAGYGTCVAEVQFVPAVIDRPLFRPVPAVGGLGKRVRARVIELGARLGSTWTEASDGTLRLQLDQCPAPPPGSSSAG